MWHVHYKVQFPDAGLRWYHPHIRKDFAQEMGLYGTIIVEPTDPGYWQPVDRQLTLTLDDLLVEDGQIAPIRKSGPTLSAMSRFGNVMLINGETEFSAEMALGEVVRLYLVNTANTRSWPQCSHWPATGADAPANSVWPIELTRRRFMTPEA
jgi:FtsP/CotA-like multicopper oxidase with cupredoxin domain